MPSPVDNHQPDAAPPVAKRILLAEDDVSVRRLLEVVLRRAGYEILPAEDGLAAMAIATENHFDIAVLDAMMPNMTGYELCRIFRGHPVWQHIPLVILSGLESETNTEADAYLLKTANIQHELLEIVARLLSMATPRIV